MNFLPILLGLGAVAAIAAASKKSAASTSESDEIQYVSAGIYRLGPYELRYSHREAGPDISGNTTGSIGRNYWDVYLDGVPLFRYSEPAGWVVKTRRMSHTYSDADGATLMAAIQYLGVELR